MAKVTAESREQFNNDSAAYKAKIKEILAQEKALTSEIAKDKSQEGVLKIELAELMLYAASVHIIVNNMSWEIMNVKNEDALNDARKLIYKAIIYLEDIVTNIVDSTADDLKDRLPKIEAVPLEKRYYLTRKLGLTIQLVIDAYGDNSKWKWSFVEMQGRFIAVAKNMLDMPQVSKDYYDGASELHDISFYYIRLLKTWLPKCADNYREKYELSTRRADDMRMGINFLMAYRRLLVNFGDKDEAEEIKKKIQVWKSKMETDSKEQKK